MKGKVDAAQHPFSEDIQQRIRGDLRKPSKSTRVVEMYPIPAKHTQVVAGCCGHTAAGCWHLVLLPADKVEIQLQILQTQTGETKK